MGPVKKLLFPLFSFSLFLSPNSHIISAPFWLLFYHPPNLPTFMCSSPSSFPPFLPLAAFLFFSIHLLIVLFVLSAFSFFCISLLPSIPLLRFTCVTFLPQSLDCSAALPTHLPSGHRNLLKQERLSPLIWEHFNCTLYFFLKIGVYTRSVSGPRRGIFDPGSRAWFKIRYNGKSTKEIKAVKGISFFLGPLNQRATSVLKNRITREREIATSLLSAFLLVQVDWMWSCVNYGCI